eukprot:Colp12_sorted_trinity150504_noHs@27400
MPKANAQGSSPLAYEATSCNSPDGISVIKKSEEEVEACAVGSEDVVAVAKMKHKYLPINDAFDLPKKQKVPKTCTRCQVRKKPGQPVPKGSVEPSTPESSEVTDYSSPEPENTLLEEFDETSFAPCSLGANVGLPSLYGPPLTTPPAQPAEFDLNWLTTEADVTSTLQQLLQESMVQPQYVFAMPQDLLFTNLYGLVSQSLDTYALSQPMSQPIRYHPYSMPMAAMPVAGKRTRSPGMAYEEPVEKSNGRDDTSDIIHAMKQIAIDKIGVSDGVKTTRVLDVSLQVVYRDNPLTDKDVIYDGDSFSVKIINNGCGVRCLLLEADADGAQVLTDAAGEQWMALRSGQTKVCKRRCGFPDNVDEDEASAVFVLCVLAPERQMEFVSTVVRIARDSDI